MPAMQGSLSLPETQPLSPGSNKRSASISRAGSAYPRKRAVTACQVCRSRKTKCDQKKPTCSFCESIGADCNSDPGSLSSFDPASILIIERLDNLQRKLDSIHQVPVPILHPHVTSRDSSVNGAPHHERPLGNFIPESLASVLKWPLFQHLSLPALRAPSQCSPISSGSLTQGPPISISDELHPAACNQWLDDFFRHDHCKNPMLDEQSTRRLTRRVCQEGVGWDAESCLVLLVCANGALARPLCSPSVSGSELASSISNALFTAALKRLGPTMGSNGVVQAQCMFLAGMFLMSSLRPFDAWRMFLQSLAICQGFTYRDQLACFGEEENRSAREAEESIYWSAWKSERELRWELGLPEFGDVGSDTLRTFPSCSKPYEGDNLRAWYFYLSEISLWRLETVARYEMTRLVAETPTEILTTLAEMADETVQQVIAWQNSLPPNLNISRPELSKEDDDDVLRFVLRGRTTYFHEMLSWPFIYAVVNDGNEAPRVREWAARGFAFHMERLNINRPGFRHRHHGTWLMMQSSARSACILLAGAQSTTTSDLLPVNWHEAVEATLSMLNFWFSNSEGLSNTVDPLTQLLAKIYEHE